MPANNRSAVFAAALVDAVAIAMMVFGSGAKRSLRPVHAGGWSSRPSYTSRPSSSAPSTSPLQTSATIARVSLLGTSTASGISLRQTVGPQVRLRTAMRFRAVAAASGKGWSRKDRSVWEDSHQGTLMCRSRCRSAVAVSSGNKSTLPARSACSASATGTHSSRIPVRAAAAVTTCTARPSGFPSGSACT